MQDRRALLVPEPVSLRPMPYLANTQAGDKYKKFVNDGRCGLKDAGDPGDFIIVPLPFEPRIATGWICHEGVGGG
jgi:hypothetical protein